MSRIARRDGVSAATRSSAAAPAESAVTSAAAIASLRKGAAAVGIGPVGVELAVKFALNRLTAPVEHRFWTVPVSLRGTLTF
jgi:hypothetical protein